MSTTITKEYVAHLDSKHRFTIRTPQHSYYQVREYSNGYILLEPRELSTPASITKKSLKEMEKIINDKNSDK